MAATAAMHQSYGLGPRGPNPPHGAPQGARHPAPGPSGAPRPEEQHHKPFFYIQPPQPYVPMQGLQWPVPVPIPVSYNPYYGYPGLGYGVPVMPHYQPNPYLEPPGFVVPHTHLHLMDYRRMLNPQYYHTMAYHSRRFRYQHSGPAREMTSSQVQTEPLSAAHRTSTPSPGDARASGGLLACASDSPRGLELSPPSAVQKKKLNPPLELRDTAPPSPSRTSPPNGGFLIQTEEVRIECCTTPVGLQLLHSHETAEVSHRYSEDVVQCSAVLQGGVLQEDKLRLPAEPSEKNLQAHPDILFVGGHSEEVSAPEDSTTRVDPVPEISYLGSQVPARIDAEDSGSKNFPFKVVHLPFDSKYLDELRRMESTVWSAEETLIPSPESLIQNHRTTDSHDDTLQFVAEMSTEVFSLREDDPTEQFVSMMEMPPLAEEEPEDTVPTEEGPVDEMICPTMDVSETKLKHAAEVDLLLENSPLKLDGNQQRRETNLQDQQDTSFESLPTYLPSTSWLADFDNVYCCGKRPATPKKPSRPGSSCALDVPARRRKLDLEYKEQQSARKHKERYKPKGKAERRSLSDHECCMRRNFNQKVFTAYPSKRERLCSRCLSKRRTQASPGTAGGSSKRKAVPLQQWNEALVPTCDACKFHPKKLVRKGSIPDVRVLHHGLDTEGESSENGSYHRGPKWRPAEDPRTLPGEKRPLASKQNVEKFPAATYPKLREKNCACNEPQRQPVAWERLRHCPHGNNIPEMDENCAMPRNVDHIYLTHRWQTGSHSSEKPWKAMMPNQNGDLFKNETRSQHLNKHKKSQSQGTLRKDTRC